MYSNLQHALTFIIQNTINLQVWIKYWILTTPSRLQKPQEKNPNKEQNLKLRSYKKTDFFSISHYKATLRHKKINDLKLIYATKWKLIQSQRNEIGGLLFFVSLFHINNEVQRLLLRMGMFNKLNIRATLKIIKNMDGVFRPKKKYCINLYRKFSNFEYFNILL